jgi:predicted SAM-dependent methyltransferase
MNTAIKQKLEDANLLPLAEEVKELGKLVKYQFHRQFGLVDRQVLDRYLQQNTIRKLHIGCGHNPIDGWLNSDYRPIPTDQLRLDATKTFPIDNSKFDYIFSEHMIEHISYAEGLSMLTECFRVLRQNGTIRISTPSLSFLLDLYRSDKSERQLAYIKWATDNFIPETDYYDETFVVNNFVRNWGHQFIYDEKILRSALEKAGFMNITKYDLNQSDEEPFKNLENELRLPAGFLQMETLTLEGKKLADS